MSAEAKRIALEELDEVRSWKCESCDTLIETENSRYCRACAAYWEDVRNGLFEDEP